MKEILDYCFPSVLTKEILDTCVPFSCGDDDMDEFFYHDALEYTQYRMGKSYCFRLIDNLPLTTQCYDYENNNQHVLETLLLLCRCRGGKDLESVVDDDNFTLRHKTCIKQIQSWQTA